MKKRMTPCCDSNQFTPHLVRSARDERLASRLRNHGSGAVFYSRENAHVERSNVDHIRG